MNVRFMFILLAISCGATGVAGAESTPTVSPRSLAGDWEYVAIPTTAKLIMHLHVDAAGAITGTIDMPGPPTKRFELRDVHLVGNMLTYTMPPLPGHIHEVVMPGAKKMMGPQMWERPVNVVKVTLSPQQLAGDWCSDECNRSGTVLHLRVASNGKLTGKVDILGLIPSRRLLSDIRFDGSALSFVGPNASVFHGALSTDGRAISGHFTGSSGPSTWRRFRSAAQAAVADSRERPRVTDGSWSGVGSYIAKFPGLGPSKGEAHITFLFGSNPTSCSVDMGDGNKIWCGMTQTGNAILVKMIAFQATFTGALSTDRNHLSGTWRMGNTWHWTGPMQIDLARKVPAE